MLNSLFRSLRNPLSPILQRQRTEEVKNKITSNFRTKNAKIMQNNLTHHRVTNRLNFWMKFELHGIRRSLHFSLKSMADFFRNVAQSAQFTT